MDGETMNGHARPDIFITGVMKGGTTILHDYICTHPMIRSGSQKEIHYFSLNYDKGVDWYDEHFKSVPEGVRTIDASPTYFDVANTALMPSLIRAFAEDPRVIVITRDPIERAVSHFVHLQKVNRVGILQHMGADTFFEKTLAEAWGQRSEHAFFLHQVLDFSLYYRKFVTYRRELEPEQFLVLDNDALRRDPKGTMARVFDFLDVDYVDNKSFGVVKYSNGSSIDGISTATYERLAELFYPDYEMFCHQAGFEFVEARRAA